MAQVGNVVQKSPISGYSNFLEFDFHPDFQIIFKSVLMIKELFITLFLIGWSESKDWDFKLIVFSLVWDVVSSPGTSRTTLSARRSDFSLKLPFFINRTILTTDNRTFHVATALKDVQNQGRMTLRVGIGPQGITNRFTIHF